MKTIINIILSFFLVIGLTSCGWLSDVRDTIAKELQPDVLLKRYEWFKDVSAQCDKKMADIQVYKNRLTSMEKSYEGKPRSSWDRTDKEQFNLWEQEISGTIASYNDLAATYNSAMAKINYSFTNIGQLPQGAKEPLPREIKPYVYE